MLALPGHTSEQKTVSTIQNYRLTGKAPYRFESLFGHIRVSSKHELKQRLIAFIGDMNREPVVHTGATKSTMQHDPHKYVILKTLY
jgi:hypothetical protein